MKLQRYDGRQGIYQGQWCMDEDVSALETERDAARRSADYWKGELAEANAENDRLRAELGRIESTELTHAEGCWSWGRQHYGCALREIERLKQPQKPVSADEVTESGIFKGLADSIWIMGAQFGWECCEANDKDRFNHAINTRDFPIAVQVPLKFPEV